MSLVYGTGFRLQDSHTGERASLEQVASVIANWAEVDLTGPTGTAEGRRKAVVSWDTLTDSMGLAQAWKLRLSHPDASDDGVFWTAEAAVVFVDDATRFTLRLERTRHSGLIQPLSQRPKPPRCVRAVLDDDALVALDGDIELRSGTWVVGVEEAAEFAGAVRDQSRNLPIIGFTPRDEDVIDGVEFATPLRGIAHVARIRSAATWELDHLLPSGFNVYGGAVRLWWPGITERSAKWDHPLWTGDRHASTIRKEIVATVQEASLASGAASEPRLAQLERQRRDAELLDLRRSITDLRAQFAERTKAAESEADHAAASELSEQLDAAETEAIDRLTQESEDLEKLATDYAAERDEALQQLRNLSQERDYLRKENVRIAKELARAPSGFDADEADFRTEVDAVLENLDGHAGAEPRQYRLGAKFLETLEQHGERYRGKAARTAAVVIARSPEMLRNKEDHPLRTGAGGADSGRVRSIDGAEARRCPIEQHVPAARRLHYWLCMDGSIELASLNVHDDMTIPD